MCPRRSCLPALCGSQRVRRTGHAPHDAAELAGSAALRLDDQRRGRRPTPPWPAQRVGGVGFAGLFGSFFRDPERRLTPDPAVVYAAADGVVTSIEEDVGDAWLPNGAGIRISTFLGLHNVHVTRSPVAGKVTRTESVPGGFAPALFPRSGNNTRRRLAIDGAAGRVVVVQVAGLLARKISCWVEQGESVAAGQRVGMIHLGSRADVLLPRDCANATMLSTVNIMIFGVVF